MDLRFYEVLGLQKVKKGAKNDFLPHFWDTESSLGRLQFWRGKWPPNSEILVGLESRLIYLSKTPTLAQFGHLEVPQKWSQRRTTRQPEAHDPSGKLLQISVYSSEKRSLTLFDFLGWIIILFDVINVILWHFYSYLPLLEDSFMKKVKIKWMDWFPSL